MKTWSVVLEAEVHRQSPKPWLPSLEAQPTLRWERVVEGQTAYYAASTALAIPPPAGFHVDRATSRVVSTTELEPHQVRPPSTEEELEKSDNLVIKEAHKKAKRRKHG